MKDFFTSDSASAFVKRATDILFIQNPTGSALGVLFGTVLHGLSLVFAPELAKITFLDFNRVYAVYYVLLGMFVFNLRSYFRRRELSPEIERAFETIKLARKSGNMGELEAKIEYRKLIQKVLEEIALPQSSTTQSKPIRKRGPQLPTD